MRRAAQQQAHALQGRLYVRLGFEEAFRHVQLLHDGRERQGGGAVGELELEVRLLRRQDLDRAVRRRDGADDREARAPLAHQDQHETCGPELIIGFVGVEFSCTSYVQHQGYRRHVEP